MKPLFPLNKTVLNFQGRTRLSLCQPWLKSQPGGRSKTSFLAFAKANLFFFPSSSCEVDKGSEQPPALWEKRACPFCKAAGFLCPPANVDSRSGCCSGWAYQSCVQQVVISQKLYRSGVVLCSFLFCFVFFLIFKDDIIRFLQKAQLIQLIQLLLFDYMYPHTLLTREWGLQLT